MSSCRAQNAQFGRVDSSVVPKKPRSIQSFLLELSSQFGKDTEENLKVFVADHGQLQDSGFLSSTEIEQSKSMFGLLMNLVNAQFMNPNDMSNLIDFLDAAGEKTVSKKVQEFEAQTEESRPSMIRRTSTVGQRPRLFRWFLLELSTHIKKKAEDNLRVYVAPHVQCADPDYLPCPKIEQTTTVFGLLMALVDVGFMKPHDMSKLIDFLDAAGEKTLSKKVQEFETQTKENFLKASHAKIQVTKVQQFQAPAEESFTPRSSASCTITATPFGQSDLHTPPPDVDEAAVMLCQAKDQTRDELIIPSASVLAAKSQNCEGFLSTAAQHSNDQNLTPFYRQRQASANTPKRSTQPNHSYLPDDAQPPPLKQRKYTSTTDERCGVDQLAAALLPRSRLTLLHDWNSRHKLQKAMQCIVIGNYAGVLRGIHSYLEKFTSGQIGLVMETAGGFGDRDGITLDFGLGTQQQLPIQALNHPAIMNSSDYENILQLIMEAVLMGPNPEENLAKILHHPNLRIPKSLKLLFRSRLPSVAMNEELQLELATQCRHLAKSLREEQQSNFAASKNPLYLAQVYDATAHINGHQQIQDFRGNFMQKADFHRRAIQERQNYEPCTDLEKAILRLESTRSAQSQGYAYAEMATNGTESLAERREHAEEARTLHERAINVHATPLLELLRMHEGMSEGAALVANLRFDEMLRKLRPAQLDYQLYYREWSEEERERKLKDHLALIVNEFGRIRDLLSSRTTVVPVLEDLLQKMVESMVPLEDDVAQGCIKGFALNDPTMNE